jgi:hypothetical protein
VGNVAFPWRVGHRFTRLFLTIDFQGNIIKRNLLSKTATKLVREWIDLHLFDLEEDWLLARASKEIKKIEPLN